MRPLFLCFCLSFTGFVAAQTTPDTLAGVSPEFFLNAGNEAFGAGRVGPAILAYERGLRLRPGDADLSNNLAYVRQQAELENLELPVPTLLRWWRQAGAALGAAASFWVALLCWWIAVGGIVFWWLRRGQLKETQRFALLPLAVLFLGFSVLFYTLGSSRNALLNDTSEAILLEAASLRVAPGPDATLEEELRAGLKFRLLDRFNNYRKVSLPDGRQGWVPSNTVAEI